MYSPRALWGADLVGAVQREPVGRSLFNAIAFAVAASVFGLFGLPTVFGSLPDRESGLMWLALALVTCACLLVPLRPIVSALASQLNGLPGTRGAPAYTGGRTSLEIGRLLVAAAYLVLFQAVSRRPLTAVFGASVDPFLVEASFTIVALLLLLALLAWVYAAARPLLERMAWAALDSALATSGGSERPEGRDALAETTVVASRPVASEAYIATVLTPRPAGDEAELATVVAPQGTVSETETATALSPGPPAGEAETELVRHTPPDRSLDADSTRVRP